MTAVQPATRVALYRLYDRDDRLLYVGISYTPTVRLVEHAKTQPWWHRVARHTINIYETRTEAAAAELSSIREEWPEFNFVGAPRRTEINRVEPAASVRLMASAEIIDALDVSTQRAHTLMGEASFPLPIAALRVGRIWLAEDVEEWMRTTGRIRKGNSS